MRKTIVLFPLILISVFAFAQKRWGETPEDSVQCVTNYSLYREFVKQKNYKDAAKSWRYMFNKCPQSTKYAYIDGINIIETLMKEHKENKEKYIDTIMLIYDQRIKYFGEEGKVLGKKGTDWYQYRHDDLQGAYDILKKSIDLEGSKSEAGVLAVYYQILSEMLEKGLITKDIVIEQYLPVMDAIEYNIANTTKESTKEMYEKAKNNINELFSRFAQCPDIINLFKPKFEAQPDDINLLKVIIKLLDKVDCVGEQLYKDVAVALYRLEPSCEAAMANGDMFAKDDNCGKAIDYYKQAAEQCEDEQVKINAYIKLSKCNIKIKQLTAARMYAQKVLAIKPNYGEAYILIGDAYANSAGECGDNDCTKKAIYWVAIDKYNKAKDVDSSIAEEANQKIAAYSNYFPKKSDCFFYGINDGDSYTIGCWINETTTVRVQ